jgi:hypothetical protein
MEKSYYVLATREDGAWGVHFGDYDRAVVEQEQADCGLPRSRTRIARTGDSQASIDAAIAKLNGEG